MKYDDDNSSVLSLDNLIADENPLSLPGLQTNPFEIFYRSKHKLRGYLAMLGVKKQIECYGKTVWKFSAQADSRSKPLRNIFSSKDSEMYTTSRCLFSPDSKFQVGWNILIFFLVLYVIVVTPWVIAFETFERSNPFFYTENSVDLLFFLDILFNFNTAYYNKSGSLVTSRKDIAKNYFTGMLIIDVVSIFPFFIIFRDNGSSAIMRIFRILKIVKVFRAAKLPVILNKFEDIEALEPLRRVVKTYNGIIRLFVCLLLVLIMAHMTACIWFYTARMDNFSSDTWIEREGFDHNDKGFMYLASLYWAFTVFTTIGFGDIHAFTVGEMVVCIIWMFLGVMFYSLIIGSLTSILSNFDSRSIKIKRLMKQVSQFAALTKIPVRLANMMKMKLKKSFKEESLDDEQILHIFELLPSKTKFEVASAMYDYACHKIRFFQGKSNAFIADIIPKLKFTTYTRLMPFYLKGEVANAVFFIVQGRAVYVHDKLRVIFKEITDGSYFGEIEIIKKRCRTYSVFAKENCDVLAMNKFIFAHMIEAYPFLQKEIYALADTRELSNYESLAKVKTLFRRTIPKLSLTMKKKKKYKSKTVKEQLYSKIDLLEIQALKMKKKLNCLETTLSEVKSVAYF